MGWFEEQIRERKEADQALFEDSFRAIAGAVMGRRMSEALNNERQVTTDAIGEILRYYHVRPQEVPETIRDMNEVLEYLMRPSGIMRRSVKLGEGWYKDAAGAMLGTRRDDGTVVALLPWGPRGYRFFDRKTGEYVRLNRESAGLIDEEAFVFYKPFPLKKMNTRDLMKYILEQVSPADIAILAAAVTAATAAGMIMPRLNALLFSDVMMSGSARLLVGMAVFMACAVLSALVFSTVKSFATARIAARAGIAVEAASMMRVLSLPADFFKQYSSGELASRINSVSILMKQMTETILSTGLVSLFSLAYISQIFVYAPALAWPAVMIILASLAVSAATVLVQVKVTRQQLELAAKESGVCHAMIAGIQKIRLAGAETRAFARWGKAYAEAASPVYNPPVFLKIGKVISLAISTGGMMILYYTAIRSNVSVPDYYAFNSAYGMVSGAFLALSEIAASAAQIKPIMDMAKPILETEPEIDGSKIMVTKLSGGIELNNVSFRYQEDMPLILDNVSLKIRPGQYVAIVGKTGCGKSTLMRILLGFEKPQKGAVYYDGRDLKALDPKSLRRCIGSVIQDGKLFMGDMYSNITVSAPWLTLDDAWEAAETAGLAEDIRQMPMGMNTLISEGQGGISGGQRQRIMIARAIAPKPKILMFDEATSALDNLTQKQVSEALDRMNCTRIVIAHRLSTIRQCDRIIVLEGGRIVEDGTYEELIAGKGYFSELVARQMLDRPEGKEA